MLKLLFLIFPLSVLVGQTPVINFRQLQDMSSAKRNDTLYIVNFWATWCDPCVKEMPHFKQATLKYAHQKVKFIFASQDALRELPKVNSFANKNKLSDVVLLHGDNPNDWIDKIDSSWSGAIPATVFYRNGKKLYFREGEFTLPQLENTIQLKLKKQ